MIVIFKEGGKLHIVAIAVFILFIVFYIIQKIGMNTQSNNIVVTDGEKYIEIQTTEVSYSTNELYVKDFICEVRSIEKREDIVITIYNLESLIKYLESQDITWVMSERGR